MEPINKQDVLIRLLKDGHISNEEFKALYEPEQVITSGYLTTDNDFTYPGRTIYDKPRYVNPYTGDELTTN